LTDILVAITKITKVTLKHYLQNIHFLVCLYLLSIESSAKSLELANKLMECYWKHV